MEERQVFNAMPRPTFRWLRVNHYEGQLKTISQEGPSTVMTSGDVDALAPLTHTDLLSPAYEGVNRQALALVKDQFRTGYSLTVEEGASKKVALQVTLTAASPYEALRLFVDARKGSHLDLTILVDSEGDFEGQCHLLTEILAQSDAQVTVKKALLCNETIQTVEHRYTSLAEGAQVDFVNVELGGQENLYNFENNIEGYKSHLTHDFAYLGDKEQRFDIAMLMSHGGKKSQSEIQCLGALTGTSKKAFRGTLDFLLGCAGSEGSEEDTCLLLNDQVKSISVPLLLCKEDDVVGNHAASAGQMDANKLFYLMSRGFSENEAKHMLVESMLRPIIDKMGDEALEERALEAIRNKI